MEYSFDAGWLFYVPKAPLDLTPIYFGDLKSVLLTITPQVTHDSVAKYAWGTYPMVKTFSATGVAKNAGIRSRALGPLFFGKTLVAGSTGMVTLDDGANNPLSVPGSPYQITVAPPNAGVFMKDLGVYYADSGLQLMSVSVAPAVGQYQLNVSTGTYTFNAADTARSVKIAYLYTQSTGFNFNAAQQIPGALPTFEMILMNQYQGKQRLVYLYSCSSKKLTFQPMMERYEIPSFEFDAWAKRDDVTGLVGNFSTAE
jgi:hypothetical protein